VTLPT